MWVVYSNIVIGLSILDMWSVLCVPYVGVWDLIASDKDCSVLDMWSVLFVLYVGGMF